MTLDNNTDAPDFNFNKDRSNSVKLGIADRCCPLENHKWAIASSGWGINPQISTSPAGRDPHHWTPQAYLPNSI